MTAILEEIVQLLTGGLVEMAKGIGEGLNEFVKEIFLTTTTVEGVSTQHLSAFGSIIIVFAGVSLAIALSRWVVNLCTSLGARNR